MTISYFRGAHGIMIVYDITDRKSFDTAKKWLDEIDREIVNKLLVGNKCDMDTKRQVEYEEAKAFAEEHGIPFLETSGRAATNVETAFIQMASDIKSRLATVPAAEEAAGGAGKSGSVALGRGEDVGKPAGGGRCFA